MSGKLELGGNIPREVTSPCRRYWPFGVVNLVLLVGVVEPDLPVGVVDQAPPDCVVSTSW